MGLVTDVATFIRTPKEIARKIDEDPKKAKKEFILGIVLLSIGYGMAFPLLKMGFGEEALKFVAKDAIAFPIIFMLSFIALVLPLNLIIPDGNKVLATFALWFDSVLLITLAFIPLLFISTIGGNTHHDKVIGLNGLVVVLGTVIGAAQTRSCLEEIYTGHKKKLWIVVVVFTVLILWSLLNAQNLFTLSGNEHFYRSPMIGVIQETASKATITHKVV